MAWRGGSVVALIPARLGSTRFPRKALADETGTPLVVHVCERAREAPSVERVVVATDAEEIATAVRTAGFEAVMTGEHPNGTSRLVEASRVLGLSPGDVVVNVQGDEPEIEPGVIDAAVGALRVEPGSAYGADAGRRRAAVGTVASPIAPGDDPADPNVVKVVLGAPARASDVAPALYFSRAAIPHDRDGDGGARWLRHVGIYAYLVETLGGYASMDETPLERAERLEQLRWLEHGLPIAVAVRESSHAGIDTPEQYRAFVERRRAANTG